MNCGDGSPQYNVVVHEMGHNFSLEAQGMVSLLVANSRRIADTGFIECVASLPIIYLEQEIVSDPARYGFVPSDFEVSYYQGNIDHYCPDSEAGLEEFEAMIAGGQIEGIFDIPGCSTVSA